MKLIQLLSLIVLLASCAKKGDLTSDKNAKGNETGSVKSIATQEVLLTASDTAAMFAKYPVLKDKSKGTPFDSLSLKRKYQLLEARTFFGNTQFELGTFGDQFYTFLKTNQGKDFDKSIVCKYLKFEEGKTELKGVDKIELKEIFMATYSSVNLYFKVNVNAKDPIIRKERLENVKKEFIKIGLDMSKVEFGESLEPEIKDNHLVILLHQKLPPTKETKK